MEILAPCGADEAISAAVNSGADAVYIGATRFSARRNARNFDAEQLKNAVRLCHESGVKVYITLNTLVFDDEMEQLCEVAREISEAKADAIIVQDLGVASVLKEIVPHIPLHASTQMSVCSASGALAAKKAGFSRVVLAREMSFEEIKRVVDTVDIETEVFVHGALCVCVSGQCYMSAVLGGRSGNRGLCAQPCRLAFSSCGKENVLSLKDLSIVNELKALEAIGVTSAKIECRMKRPEYVAAAVTACRDVLDGKEPDMNTLKAVFSRSGFTESYFDGTLKNMQGMRTKDDVIAASGALNALKKLYEKPYKRYYVDMSVEIKAGREMRCRAFANGVSVTVSGDVPQAAQNKSVSAEDVCERMKKLGGTIFEAGNITCCIGDNLYVGASSLNALRRDVIAALLDEFCKKE